MSDHISRIENINADKLKAQQLAAIKQTESIDASQDAIESTLEENGDDAIFGYFQRTKNFQTLTERFEESFYNPEEAEQDEKITQVTKTIQNVEDAAKKFNKNNPELNAKALVIIRSLIKEGDSSEDILRKIQSTYADHYLTDDTLDFLVETAIPGSEHYETLKKTKERFNTLFEREIKAGRNIAQESRNFSQIGLGTPTGLRDLYRDITGNPREPVVLFGELIKTFDFEKLKQVIDFILHSLGSDMKAKGPSISIGELQNLFGSARTMQAILGVFRFFQSRMNLIGGAFQRSDLELPSRLTFQLLSDQFMKLIAERYPSADKILKLASSLGISEEYLAQIIIFTQYRDALRNVSPKMFKSDRHRQDLLKTTLDALSELEDLLEEEEEEDEDSPPKKRKTQDTME
ncbi:MAG: hypothetical protein HY860_00980 [Chlamydiales bacterium]|nr:hypothetical protein [Chlamydiales bacterium]